MHTLFDVRSIQTSSTLSEQLLTAENVVVTLSLLNVSGNTVVKLFAVASTTLGEGLVAIDRIQDFLSIKDLENSKAAVRDTMKNDFILDVNGMSASWTQRPEVKTLNSVSLRLKAGELGVVVGPVGSGKVKKLSQVLHAYSR